LEWHKLGYLSRLPMSMHIKMSMAAKSGIEIHFASAILGGSILSAFRGIFLAHRATRILKSLGTLFQPRFLFY